MRASGSCSSSKLSAVFRTRGTVRRTTVRSASTACAQPEATRRSVSVLREWAASRHAAPSWPGAEQEDFAGVRVRGALLDVEVVAVVPADHEPEVPHRRVGRGPGAHGDPGGAAEHAQEAAVARRLAVVRGEPGDVAGGKEFQAGQTPRGRGPGSRAPPRRRRGRRAARPPRLRRPSAASRRARTPAGRSARPGATPPRRGAARNAGPLRYADQALPSRPATEATRRSPDRTSRYRTAPGRAGHPGRIPFRVSPCAAARQRAGRR